MKSAVSRSLMIAGYYLAVTLCFGMLASGSAKAGGGLSSLRDIKYNLEVNSPADIKPGTLFLYKYPSAPTGYGIGRVTKYTKNKLVKFTYEGPEGPFTHIDNRGPYNWTIEPAKIYLAKDGGKYKRGSQVSTNQGMFSWEGTIEHSFISPSTGTELYIMRWHKVRGSAVGKKLHFNIKSKEDLDKSNWIIFNTEQEGDTEIPTLPEGQTFDSVASSTAPWLAPPSYVETSVTSVDVSKNTAAIQNNISTADDNGMLKKQQHTSSASMEQHWTRADLDNSPDYKAPSRTLGNAVEESNPTPAVVRQMITE